LTLARVIALARRSRKKSPEKESPKKEPGGRGLPRQGNAPLDRRVFDARVRVPVIVWAPGRGRAVSRRLYSRHRGVRSFACSARGFRCLLAVSAYAAFPWASVFLCRLRRGSGFACFKGAPSDFALPLPGSRKISRTAPSRSITPLASA